MRKMLSLLALAAAFAVGAAEIKLNNPGFEENGGWQVWGTPSTGFSTEDRQAVMAYDDGTAAAGTRSLKVTDKWTEHRPYVIQFVELDGAPAAGGYKLTFKAKGKAGHVFRAGFMFNRREDKKIHFLGAKLLELTLKTDDWEEFTVTAPKVPADTTTLSLVLAAAVFRPEATGEVNFDDVALETPAADDL